MPKRKRTLSVIIPVFNEVFTIANVIDAVSKSNIKNIEIIVVDDGSTDGTRDLLTSLDKKIHQLILRDKNGGKGAAVRDGIAKATGIITIIQDADLEYDPVEFSKIIEPILQNKADVVYGSRFLGAGPHRVAYFWHYVGNVLLTLYSNMWTNLNLTDMETGYKAFKTKLLQSITITENSFGMEPEITAKIAALKPSIYEVGISYYGRTYEEGKKIGFKDFFRAIWVITKFGFLTKIK